MKKINKDKYKVPNITCNKSKNKLKQQYEVLYFKWWVYHKKINTTPSVALYLYDF